MPSLHAPDLEKLRQHLFAALGALDTAHRNEDDTIRITSAFAVALAKAVIEYTSALEIVKADTSNFSPK